MVVDGACVIHVVRGGCSKPKTLKNLIIPSFEEE